MIKIFAIFSFLFCAFVYAGEKKAIPKSQKKTPSYKNSFSVGLYGKKSDVKFRSDDIVVQSVGTSLSYKIRTTSSYVFKLRLELEKIVSSRVNSSESVTAPLFANYLIGIERPMGRTILGLNVGQESYVFKYSESATTINYDTEKFYLVRPYVNYLISSNFSLGGTFTYFTTFGDAKASGYGAEGIAQYALSKNKRFGLNGKYSIMKLSNSESDYESKAITLGIYYSF